MTQKIVSNHKTVSPNQTDWSIVIAKDVTMALQALAPFTIVEGDDVQKGNEGDYIVSTKEGYMVVVPKECFMRLFAHGGAA